MRVNRGADLDTTDPEERTTVNEEELELAFRELPMDEELDFRELLDFDLVLLLPLVDPTRVALEPVTELDPTVRYGEFGL